MRQTATQYLSQLESEVAKRRQDGSISDTQTLLMSPYHYFDYANCRLTYPMFTIITQKLAPKPQLV